MSYPFNVRVYGILIHQDKVLVSDEYFHDTFMTKFPGGGLQFGEGTAGCIVREFREELKQEALVKEHFYTTDFFQESAFRKSRQIISIYYLMQLSGEIRFKTSEKKFDFPEIKNSAQSFRWIALNKLSENDFTFPIDKKVAGMIVNRFVQK